MLTVVMLLSQVVDFGFESGIVDLQVGEATVGSMELTFLDPKTNSPKTQGATKPSVIERHLTTQVGLTSIHPALFTVTLCWLFQDWAAECIVMLR